MYSVSAGTIAMPSPASTPGADGCVGYYSNLFYLIAHAVGNSKAKRCSSGRPLSLSIVRVFDVNIMRTSAVAIEIRFLAVASRMYKDR
jgi:hypothetical protein